MSHKPDYRGIPISNGIPPGMFWDQNAMRLRRIAEHENMRMPEIMTEYSGDDRARSTVRITLPKSQLPGSSDVQPLWTPEEKKDWKAGFTRRPAPWWKRLFLWGQKRVDDDMLRYHWEFEKSQSDE